MTLVAYIYQNKQNIVPFTFTKGRNKHICLSCRKI